MRLCHLSELPEGRSRGFAITGSEQDSIFIVRHGDRLHAWRDACPHHGGTPMAWRKDEYLNAAGTAIVCHAHGAQFDIETGLCTLGPCLGQSLEAVAVQLHASGDVHLNDTQETT